MFRFVAVDGKLLKKSRGGSIAVGPDDIYSDLSHMTKKLRRGKVLVYDESIVLGVSSEGLKLNISHAENGDPYRKPVEVIAAGGYVVRDGDNGREVLTISRRGVWDLPKGKLDKNETIEEAALREVHEEVGAEDLRIIAPLGQTVHGYVFGSKYAVKTTHWFLMETSSETFVPQAEEGIVDVKWVPWEDAPGMLGYQSLRDHMSSLEI